jgi:hypothetical protein
VSLSRLGPKQRSRVGRVATAEGMRRSGRARPCRMVRIVAPAVCRSVTVFVTPCRPVTLFVTPCRLATLLGPPAPPVESRGQTPTAAAAQRGRSGRSESDSVIRERLHGEVGVRQNRPDASPRDGRSPTASSGSASTGRSEPDRTARTHFRGMAGVRQLHPDVTPGKAEVQQNCPDASPRDGRSPAASSGTSSSGRLESDRAVRAHPPGAAGVRQDRPDASRRGRQRRPAAAVDSPQEDRLHQPGPFQLAVQADEVHARREAPAPYGQDAGNSAAAVPPPATAATEADFFAASCM